MWWTDGYYWYYDGLDYYSTVSNVTERALNGTGSLATLGVLAALGVLATLGLVATGLGIRRNRSGGSKD